MHSLSLAHVGLGIGNGAAAVAVTPADVKAITTSVIKGEKLALLGYTFKRQLGLSDVVYVVKGPDTFNNKGKRTTHGPYEVNLSAGTCSCPAFANRSECPHIPGARNHHSGEQPSRMEVIEREAWALREVGGDRLRVELDGNGRALILVWRSSGLALDEVKASAQQGEDVEIMELDMKSAMADGRYAGIRHIRKGGDRDVYFGTEAVATPTPAPAAPNTQQMGNPWAGGPQVYIPTDEEIVESRRHQARIAIDEDAPSAGQGAQIARDYS